MYTPTKDRIGRRHWLAVVFASMTPLINAAVLPLTLTRTDKPQTPLPVPVVIWHGLGDQYTNPGLLSLEDDINDRYPGTFVHFVRVAESGAADQRASFFGNANEQVALVCDQLSKVPQLAHGFDAVGLSQGGQFLRAYIERCNTPKVRNLITVGSQHLGVNALPPCRGFTDVFCHLVKKLAEGGAVYGDYAQHNVVPAQYFRDQSNIDAYLEANDFLRDINNERVGDEQPDLGDDSWVARRSDEDQGERNATYKENFESLEKFVMFKFSADKTVIPATSAYFTLPNVTASLPIPFQPVPLPLSSLPLYTQDYIGLRTLDESDRVYYGECQGEHMQINEACWEDVMDWLGTGKRTPAAAAIEGGAGRLVFQG